MKAAKLKNKGYEYFQKKKYDKALKYFKDAVKEDPKDTTIQQKIGDTLLKLGRNEEAVKAYKKAADQYAKKGFLMKAIGVYKLILDIKPEAEDVKDLLAKLYAERQIPEVEATTVSPSAILEIVKKKKEQVKEEEQKSEQIEVEAKEVAESSKKTVEKISALPEEEESEEEGEIEVEIEEGEENIDQFIKELGLDEEVEITLDNKEEYIEKLPTYPIFSRCSEECFKDIIDKINLNTFAPGEVIIKEGEAGKNFYIIVEGKVEVKKATGQGQVLLATLEEGAFFGEFAFLTGARRSASVVAASEVTLLEFTEDILEELLRKHPMIAEVLVEFYRERILDTMLAVSPFFQVFDPSERKEILKNFQFYEVPEETVVIEEGEEGDGFYIIMFGKVRVTKRDEEGHVYEVAVLKEGDFFGEISLLTQGPTTATVTTIERCGLFKLAAHKFQEMIMTYPQVLEITYQYKEKREDELRDLFADKKKIEEMGIV